MSKNNVRIAIRDSTDSHNVAFFDNKAGIKYKSANLHRFLAGSASILTIKYNSKDIDSIRSGCKLAFRYKNRDYWLNVMSFEKKGFEVELTAYSLGLELNNETRGEHKPANAMSIAEYVAYYDPEHALTIGVNEVSDKRIKLEWTGTDTILARLFSVANSFGAELDFNVELNDDYSLKRQVLNIYKKGNLGTNKVSQPVRVGKELKVINYSDNIKELRTAVRATGKDGLTIDGLNKKIYDNNKELLYYSSGMTVYAPQSRDRFPSVGKGSNDNWIVKDLGETQYETKEALWGYMYGEIQKISVPEITYEVEGAIDAGIGDTQTLIDDIHFEPALYVQARVSELEDDILTGKVTNSTFINFERKYSQIADSLLKQVEALAEDAAPYIIRLSTNNGYIFKNGEGSSTITARLEKYSKDIAATWKWVVDNKVVGTGDKLTVKAEQVTNTMAVTVIAYVNGNEVVRDYMTFSNSDDGVGVESIDRYFTSSDQSDGVTIEGAEWSDKPPAPTEDGKYLWAYDEITYTDGTVTTTKPAAVGANFDVDAFRAEIAEDLKDVPNREEFENKIAEELANSKAEIETQIETAKTQAESNAKEYADTINKETAKVAELANAAAGEIRADLVNVKNNLTATSLAANNAQAAVEEAKQQLETVRNDSLAAAEEAKQEITAVSNDLSKAKTDLQNAVSAVDTKATNLQSDVSNLNTSLSNTAKALQTQGTTLANQAKELQTQASQLTDQAKAQETLTTRVENVETTANDTKTTVSELSKTVTQNGKDITSVSNRTKTVETSLTSAKTSISELQTSVSTAKTDLTNLTKRTKTVEDGLTGTKTNLSELTQTVSNDGKTIASLTSRTKTVEESVSGLKTTMSSVQKDLTAVTTRTKTVEDDLSGTKTTLSQVQTTANSASQKTATLETGLNGLNAKFETLKIGSRNYFKNSKSRKYYINSTETQDVRTFIDDEFWQNDTRFTKNYVRMSFDIAFNPALPSNFTTNVHFSASPWYDCGGITFKGGTTALQHFDLKFDLSGASKSYKTDNVFIRLNNTLPLNTAVSLENFNLYLSAVVEDYNQNEADIESKVAEYKQTADQNYASLQTTVQNLDGTVQQNKTVADQTAQGFSTRIESLETYKSGESTRANQYFESAKTETARQLTAERTAIAKDYVAKSTYTSDVTGIRNDLTATTATANTTKTNLANYQASNDKAVANLQSNLQTANGNISSLKTKVEAVPGQITSAVSAVEGKIPTSIGGRNLWIQSKATGGFVEETLPDNHITGQKKCYRIPNNKELSFNIEPDFSSRLYRKVTFSAWVKYENVVQGTNNWNVFNSFKHTLYLKNSSTGATSTASYLTLGGFVGTSDWKYITYTYDYAANKSYDQLKTTIRFNLEGAKSGTAWVTGVKVEVGSIPSDYSPAPEDTAEQISSLSSELKQTKDGITLLATKTELSTAKNELQSGINTATNKANAAQNTANNNAKTINTHTTQISALNTGLSAKVSQSDFNTLSGRVTTAENNITAKANELSSKISSVESKLPSGEINLVEYGRPANGYSPYAGAEYTTHPFYYNSAFKMYIIKNTTTTEKLVGMNRFKVERNTDYTLYFKGFNNSAITNMDVWFLKRVSGSTKGFDSAQILVSGRKLSTSKAEDVSVTFNTGNYDEGYIRFDNNGSKTAGTQADLFFGDVSVKKGKSNNGWSPSLAELASSQDLKNAQSEIKQTTDSIKASVSSLDKSTVKSASLTINTDGIVMKAGKSTTDVANAIGSYFAVNQNAINLFSDKMNVKGSMIVDGAITSNKIASKSINTAHLNGKIITADVIATGAITANAIKAGAVTTDKMTANSINGDRITAGTLDAAKIKAGSITASQIASGTITSNQIKAGGISSASIAAGAITTDKIAAGAIDANKIAANAITANMIKGGQLRSTNGATVFDLNAGTLTFNNDSGYIQRVVGDKIFAIQTWLGSDSNSRDWLASSFSIRKSDNSRRSGIQFQLYNDAGDKPTSFANMWADSFHLGSSKGGFLFIVDSKNTVKPNWGDIPIAHINGGLIVKDIEIGGHSKSLLSIVEELCKKANIPWV